jgi:carboxypeptidase family protein/TonB-dependent receptor-like protein
MKKALVLFAAIFLALSAIAWGQTTFGSITGTVSDTTGAVVPGALVTLTNLGTTEKRTQPAGMDGLYSFVNLTPGEYRIDVEKTGFKHFDREPIVVEVQQTARIDVALQLGQVTQTVEVTAQTPLLETSTADLGQVIETRQVNELPLNGRNPMNLVALAPSVVPQGQSQGTPVGKNPFAYDNYQIGGAITGQGVEYLDGAPLNNAYINELSLIPTQDSLQEFKVQTNNLDAEWGRFAGGVINFSTKSGTNQLHGAAYEYLRNTVLNAVPFFDNAADVPRAPYHQNQFGFNVGGPIDIPRLYDGRNKTFFFFSYEGFRQSIGQSFVESVPTTAEKGGDFTDYRDSNGNVIPIYDPTTTTLNADGSFTRQQISCNGVLNVICPSIIANNPAVQFMLNEFATPTGAGSAFTHTANYVASSSGGGRNNEVVAKVDHNLSDRQHLFVRYSRWSNLNLPIDPFKTGVCQDRCTETFTTHSGVVDDVYNFSPTMIMDLRLSWTRMAYDRTPADVGLDLSKLGPNWAPLNNEVVLRDLPIPSFGGVDGYLNNVFGSDGAGSVITAREDMPRIAGSMTKIAGRHNIQFGGEYRIDRDNYLQTNTPVGDFHFTSAMTQVSPANSTLPNGQATGSAFAAFLLGYGNSVGQGYVNPTASQQIYPALYAQDTFSATSKLTLNLGLRWEQNGPYSERFNRISLLLPNATPNIMQPPCVTLPAGTAAAFGSNQICVPPLKGDLGRVGTPARPQNYATDKPWLQFSPRLGFAYQFTPKTVIRGGYGLFWVNPAVEFDVDPSTDPISSAGTPWITSLDGGQSPCMTPNLAVGQPACPAASAAGPTPEAGTFNLSNPFPNGIIKPPGQNTALYQTLQYGNWVWDHETNNPYAYYQQWNLDVQRELPDGTLIDLAYAATKGTHLPDFARETNALPDKYLSLGSHLIDQVPNPFFGLLGNTNGMNISPTVQLQQLLLPRPQYQGYDIAAAGSFNSIYHSLQAKVEKRMKGAGTLLVSYTLSKMITTGDVDSLISWLESTGVAGVQDWNNLRNERSLSSYDTPQRLVVSYVLDLPVGHGKRFLSNASGVRGKLISGWGAEGITLYQRGFPLNFGFPSGSATGQDVGMRPNKSASGVLSGRPESRLNEWFNTSVFSAPADYSFGNESRVDPVLRTDGITNWDFSLFKDTRFGPEGRLGLQFRAEFFNIFNHPEFGPPDTTCCSNTNGNFGHVSSQLNDPRLIQFALRFTF